MYHYEILWNENKPWVARRCIAIRFDHYDEDDCQRILKFGFNNVGVHSKVTLEVCQEGKISRLITYQPRGEVTGPVLCGLLDKFDLNERFEIIFNVFKD